jgi:hypothetical protein
VIGKVSITNKGLTNMLIKPKTKAAHMADQKLATTMPGKIYATTNKATALSIQTSSKVMMSSR